MQIIQTDLGWRADFSENTLKHMGCSVNTRLPMNIGDVYLVYGQYPAEIFEVVDSQMHFEQYFRYRRDDEITAIWGFRELVEDENYFYSLQDREKEAIEIFLDRKKEMEEFLEKYLS